VQVGGAIRCLVLAPSRELAEQIRKEAEKLLSTHGAQRGVQVGAWAVGQGACVEQR
jgi:superfamily II DNA/RNA helicase